MYLFYLLIIVSCVYESQQYQYYKREVLYSNYHRFISAKRVVQLMRTYYEESGARIKRMNPMRFMYEESPYYEMGYIMGEIIERWTSARIRLFLGATEWKNPQPHSRGDVDSICVIADVHTDPSLLLELMLKYRKVIEHAQRPMRFHFYPVYDIVEQVEITQKMYFELYQLVRMLHEIPRKWRGVKEFEDIEQIAGPELIGLKRRPARKYENMTSQQISQVVEAEERLMQMQKLRDKERRRQKKKFQKARQLFMAQGIMPEVQKRKKPRPWPIDYGWEIDSSLW